jgi:hypothetical protein
VRTASGVCERDALQIQLDEWRGRDPGLDRVLRNRRLFQMTLRARCLGALITTISVPHRAKEAGFDRHVTKPLNPKTLPSGDATETDHTEERAIADVLNQTVFFRQCSAVRSGIMSSMKIFRKIIIVVALLALALATSACPEEGPAEKAGEKIDKAIDETKDAAKDATK